MVDYEIEDMINRVLFKDTRVSPSKKPVRTMATTTKVPESATQSVKAADDEVKSVGKASKAPSRPASALSRASRASQASRASRAKARPSTVLE